MLIAIETVYVFFTLYMMLILLRWFGPWISFDLDAGRLRWTTRLTDPPIAKVRRILPPMGPFDIGPLAVLMCAWFSREVLIRILG